VDVLGLRERQRADAIWRERRTEFQWKLKMTARNAGKLRGVFCLGYQFFYSFDQSFAGSGLSSMAQGFQQLLKTTKK